jgi:glucose/arabinose dehydrogenase
MRDFKGIIVVSVALIFATTLYGDPALSAEAKIGEAAFGDWRDDAPGVRRHIRASDLQPAEVQKEWLGNFPDQAERPADAKPKVPEGFSIELIASGLENPRVIRIAPNGDLFVANSKANEVRVFRMGKDGAKPEKEEVFATDLYQPYGIAFYPLGPDPQWVYIANSHSVVRFPYKNGDLKATGEPETIVGYIPAAHHWTRDLVFSPDGKTLYVAVGSGSNVALDMFKEPFEGMEEFNKTHPLGATWDTEERRADVLALEPDGKNEKIFATGLRNCSGMAIQPATGALWCAVNERDELGDNVPFDYATEVKEGAFYGWPWYYIGNNEDPRRKGERPDLASKVTEPDVLFQAHSAPLGIVFYDGDNFPSEYRGDAFVTFHGSWNRGTRTGYKVVRVLFKDGKPTGEYEDFITGFVLSDQQVWGRPVGLAVAEDGSLFLTEDGSGTIWRIRHAK